MFRPMRRAKKAIPDEAAKRLLQTERRGVLAVRVLEDYAVSFVRFVEGDYRVS